MESKLKHLEFIQGVINRHNSNSFMIKGWTITIAAALFALAGTIKEPSVVLIALVPILLFWGLDSFYLSNERCFVDLFNATAKGEVQLPEIEVKKEDYKPNETTDPKIIITNFYMNFKEFKIWKDNHWSTVITSKSILGFYLPMFIITVMVTVLLQFFIEGKSEICQKDTKVDVPHCMYYHHTCINTNKN